MEPFDYVRAPAGRWPAGNGVVQAAQTTVEFEVLPCSAGERRESGGLVIDLER